MGYWEVFTFGCVGGVAAEILKWWKIRDELERKRLPNWSKSIPYWIVTSLMIILGGGVVIIYVRSGAVLNPFLAFHIGATAPLIISGIMREVPSIPPGKID